MAYDELEFLRRRILSSDIEELDVVLHAVLKRYTELIPVAELVCLFLPRNDMEERKRILTQSVEFLLKHPSEEKE